MFVNQRGEKIEGPVWEQPLDEAVEESPAFTETLGAAFRQENIVGSLFANQTTGVEPGVVEKGYNPWQDIQGTEYEEYFDRFVDVHNSRYANSLKRQIDMEKEDRRTMGAAGWQGMVAAMGAGILDIPTLIPGAVVTKGGSAVSVSSLAMQTAAAGAVDASLSEFGLHQTQETRGYEESLINIGASTLLSGLIGAGVGKAVGSAEMGRLKTQLEADLSDRAHVSTEDMETAFDSVIAGKPDSVGAAAREVLSADDLSIRGKAADRLGSVALFNPMVPLSKSISTSAREVVANLPEMGYALKMTGRGESQPQAVETFVKRWTLGAVGEGLEGMDGIYKNYRKGGGELDYRMFRERVGDAMRNNDTDTLGDDFITNTAKLWRRTVFDPLKKEAIDGGLLPEDVDVSTAASYFTRFWNKQKILAQEDKFREILRRHYAGAIDDMVARGDWEYATPDERLDDIEEAVRSTVAKLTGREQSSSPIQIVATERGPLKERTLNIPDEEVKEFLENDVELVARQYARVMGADVELSRKFGRADMRDQIAAIRNDYEDARKAILEQADLDEAARERQLTRLNAEEEKDVLRVEGMRDRLRGTHLLDQNTSTGGRVVQGINTFNYLRSMGGVMLSSVGDVGRHVMVNGFGPVMRDGIKPLLTNLKAVKLSRADAKLAGSVAESLHNTRMATMAELTDPYSYGHPVERWLNNAATGFSKITGMPYWNDFQKSFGAQITQARILRAAKQASEKGFDSLPKREQKHMAQLGLGRGDLDVIGDFYRSKGFEEGGVPIANLENWGADNRAYEAKRSYMAALNKAVDTTIVTKGIGDTPLWADSNAGRVVLQFKSFALASHQRVLMRAAQDMEDAPLGVLAGMSASIAIGSLIYYLKSIETGRDVSDNPGKWLAEGVDRSGLLAIFMEFNNMAEKVGAPGLYSVAQAAFPERDQSAPASRYAIRSTVGSLLGPSFGMANDVAQLMGVGGTNLSAMVGLRDEGQAPTQSDINAARRMLPGTTLPIIRPLLEHLVLPPLREAVAR